MRFLVALLLLTTTLAGCESNPVRPLDSGTVLGQVVKGEDGTGYGPVRIGLFQIEKLTTIAHQQTDDEGRFLFSKVPPGEYVPVLYDNERELFHLNEARYRLGTGHTLQLTLPMVPNPGPLQDFGLSLLGEVTHANTGEPLENVVVETTHFDELNHSLFSEIFGRSDTVTQITDSDGRFLLWPLAKLVLSPGEIGRVPHVRIYKPGFKAAYAGGWRVNQVPQILRVALEPGQDTGVITGRLVTVKGEPVANLGVALEWRRAIDGLKQDPAKITMPRLAAWSNADGFFRIEGVPDGGFVLDPSFLRDDGWVGQQAVVVEIDAARREVDAGPVIVAPAFTPDFPADGAQLRADQVRFDWQRVKDANFYRIEFRRKSDGQMIETTLESTFLDPDPSVFATPTDYTWNLIALVSLSPTIEVTRFERPIEFTVTEGIESAASELWR